MQEASRKEIVNDVSKNIILYFMQGKKQIGNLLDSLEIEGLEETISDFEDFLKISFFLKDDVIRFLDFLPSGIRRIKTENQHKSIDTKGEIKGNIDWQKTVVNQIKTSDDSYYSCNIPEKNYDILENLLLKKVLFELYTIMENNLKIPIEKKYQWVLDLNRNKKNSDGKLGDKLLNNFEQVYNKNVHLTRIQHPNTYEITDKHIYAAQHSRSQLYRKAAEIYVEYNNLLNISTDEEWKEDFKELMEQTLFLPLSDDILFEFYAFFKVFYSIKDNFNSKDNSDSNFKHTFNRIMEGSKELISAEIEEKNRMFCFYHNQQGRFDYEYKLDNLKKENVNDQEHEFLFRYKEVVVNHTKIYNELCKNKNDYVFYKLRPDITIEICDMIEKELKGVIIGEVKYTSNMKTISKGLKELLEYLQYAKYDGEYLTKKHQNEEINLCGVLIVNKLPKNISKNKFKFYPYGKKDTTLNETIAISQKIRKKPIYIRIVEANKINIDWNKCFS